MSEINMQECKSKFWHLLYFSHTSILLFQIFACLVQECESEIMFSVSTLSTLKYLQKETHYLNDSTENFAFSAFQDQIFFISVLSRFVPRSKPNDQNLGSAEWERGTGGATKRHRRRHLTPPPSSTNVERLFSVGGLTATDHRAALSGEKIDQILFLRENALMANFKLGWE